MKAKEVEIEATKTEVQALSRKLQQAMAECNPNPLVPKAYQFPVESEALNEAIAGIVALVRGPLLEVVQQQEEEIERLQALVQQLEQNSRDRP